ncbi:hypothetical protein DM02DRAFT_207545 [Periconia macrospinosa]|uniref:Uncharacterized protein n=1 Tax=Periconia macrospinosa TaxID=97972 RepID=A0A2V1D7C8_9PLEO|nr:hypothetical protein DM02DRAFT_207545 [Periconia macrospinosa]
MDDKRGQIVRLNIAFMTVSVIAISTRLLTRVFLVKRVGADDGVQPLANQNST